MFEQRSIGLLKLKLRYIPSGTSLKVVSLLYNYYSISNTHLQSMGPEVESASHSKLMTLEIFFSHSYDRDCYTAYSDGA